VLGVLTLAALAGQPSERRTARPGHVAPPETRSQAALFGCPEENPVFTRHVPPIMDIRQQQAIAARVESLSGQGWSVVFARPTRLGVFAFVDGDVEAARRVLLGADAAHVWQRDQGPEFGDGDDHDALVDQAMQWALEKPMEEVLGALRSLPNDGEPAYWDKAGAILVQWKGPLPARVASLDGMRPDGVLVIVEETPYSPREIQAANDRIVAADERGDIDAHLSALGACGDLSGALIGIRPESLGDRAGQLQEELSRIAGLPVHVVPVEPARAL
jgi:hypothetical protein